MLVRHFDIGDDAFERFGAITSDVEFDPRDEGSAIELISGALTGSRDLNVGIARVSPGERHIRHHHPNGSEFYVFLSGRAILEVDGVEYEAVRGTAVYLPPGTVHAIRNVESETVDLIYGLSRPEYADIGLVYDE
jgi:mannose-6-phosphate isomerase-like protein (cupin superfamily)